MVSKHNSKSFLIHGQFLTVIFKILDISVFSLDSVFIELIVSVVSLVCLCQDVWDKTPSNIREEWVALRLFRKGILWEGRRKSTSASMRLRYLSQRSGFLWLWISFALLEDWYLKIFLTSCLRFGVE